MSLKQATKVETNRVQLEVEVDAATFEQAVAKAYKKNVAKMQVPGFRKGKAPRALVEKMYGKGYFYDEALNNLIPGALYEALEEAKEEPVGRPDYEVVSIDENGAEIKATFPVKPELKIEGYKGIAVEKKIAKVTEEEVDARILSVRERNSRSSDVTDRAAKEGDIAVIDYLGTVDGVAFDGGAGNNYELKLGSNTFIPGFEDQVAGHSIGDEFDVNVTFPEDYHAEELKGKAAVFACKLNGIKENMLPEADDEFAKDVSEFDTFAEYKADVEKSMKEQAEAAAEGEMSDKLFEALADKLEADIPEAMFENETEQQVRDFEYRLRSNGLDLNTYLKYTGMTLEGIKADMRPRAEKQVKTRLALEKIAELENITVSDEEIENEIKRIADAYKMDAEEIKNQISKDMLISDLKNSKAADLVKAEAAVTEAE